MFLRIPFLVHLSLRRAIKEILSPELETGKEVAGISHYVPAVAGDPLTCLLGVK